MYAKVINNEVVVYPYTLEQLRKDNPNVSFPVHIGEDVLNAFDVVIVHPLAPPETNWMNNLVEDTPILVDGIWRQRWEIQRANADQIRERVEVTLLEVNARRSSELSDSDWTMMPDVTLTEEELSEWQAYRQALRDLTKQPGYPMIIDWPTKPAKEKPVIDYAARFVSPREGKDG